MNQRWIGAAVAAGSIALCILAFARLIMAFSIMLFLTGVLVLLSNLFRPTQGARLSPRLTGGIGLLSIYYATLAYLQSRGALTPNLLGMLSLIALITAAVAARYLWTARREQTGRSRWRE